MLLTGPIELHLTRGTLSQFASGQPLDKMQRHIDPGRDARRRYDSTFVDPAQVVSHLRGRERRLEIVDILPVCRCLLPIQQPGLRQQEGAGADRRSEAALCRCVGYPTNDYGPA